MHYKLFEVQNIPSYSHDKHWENALPLLGALPSSSRASGDELTCGRRAEESDALTYTDQRLY
jgi:hypothetical protein